MRSRFLSSNLFRWNKTLREDCSLLFYGWYSAGLRDIFWDSNSTFKYHSFETMMLKWNETRLLDLSCLEFTGPTLKLLASGRRSNVKFKPWMVKRTLVLKCQKQSVNCYLFFFFLQITPLFFQEIPTSDLKQTLFSKLIDQQVETKEAAVAASFGRTLRKVCTTPGRLFTQLTWRDQQIWIAPLWDRDWDSVWGRFRIVNVSKYFLFSNLWVGLSKCLAQGHKCYD